jgi:hypothetical protein
MAIRDDIKSQIETNLASYTQFKVSSELPFTVSGDALYLKNKKTVYLDEQEDSKVQLYRTLDQGEVYQTETFLQVYLTTDAKNQPSDIDSVVNAILDAKSAVTGTQINESSYESDIEDDMITYTFEYNITKL